MFKSFIFHSFIVFDLLDLSTNGTTSSLSCKIISFLTSFNGLFVSFSMYIEIEIEDIK